LAISLIGPAHALSAANPIARFVAGDAVRPGRKGGGISEPSDPAADHDPGFLQHVPGRLLVVRQPPSKPPQAVLPSFDQFGEGLDGPFLSPDHQQFVFDPLFLVHPREGRTGRKNGSRRREKKEAGPLGIAKDLAEVIVAWCLFILNSLSSSTRSRKASPRSQSGLAQRLPQTHSGSGKEEKRNSRGPMNSVP